MTYEEEVKQMLEIHCIQKNSHSWQEYTLAKMAFNTDFGWVTHQKYQKFIEIVCNWIGL